MTVLRNISLLFEKQGHFQLAREYAKELNDLAKTRPGALKPYHVRLLDRLSAKSNMASNA